MRTHTRTNLAVSESTTSRASPENGAFVFNAPLTHFHLWGNKNSLPPISRRILIIVALLREAQFTDQVIAVATIKQAMVLDVNLVYRSKQTY
jgi:hypothetical protein